MNNRKLGTSVRVLIGLLVAVMSFVSFQAFAQADFDVDDRSCGETGCVDTTSVDAPWVRWYEAHGGDAQMFSRIWSPDFVFEEGPLGETYCEILESLFGVNQRLHWMNTKSTGNVDLLEFHGANLWSITTRSVDLKCAWSTGLPTWDSVLGFGFAFPDGLAKNRGHLINL